MVSGLDTHAKPDITDSDMGYITLISAEKPCIKVLLRRPRQRHDAVANPGLADVTRDSPLPHQLHLSSAEGRKGERA